MPRKSASKSKKPTPKMPMHKMPGGHMMSAAEMRAEKKEMKRGMK